MSRALGAAAARRRTSARVATLPVGLFGDTTATTAGGRQNSLVRVQAQQARNARRTAISGGRVDPRHGTVQGRGSGRHGTICEKVDTTRSVPPAAFTAGITSGSASRGTAAFTA